MNEIIDIVEVYIAGPQGAGGVIESATATGLPPGADPTVTLGGTPEVRTIAFGIPEGEPGAPAAITGATAETLPPQSDATVTVGGTSTARTFTFGIPKGDPGAGSVNSVNGDLGPDILLSAEDVGAVPSTQYATETVRGIVELATPSEAAAGDDAERAVTPLGLTERERSALAVYSSRDYGAVGDGSANDTAALQSAIDAAAGATLIIPPGVYMIDATLRLKEGSRVVGYGATLRRVSGFSASLVGNYEQGDTTTTRYNGNGNIEVAGLTLDGNSAPNRGNMMLFVHSRNVIVRDCTFITCTGFHHLEFNSTDGALAQNCRFLGFIPDPTASYRKEAVQIDSARTGLTVGGAGDGTPSRNVTIEGCYFGPDDRGNEAPNICVGGHNSVETSEFYTNIRVLNCVGEGMRIGGVWMLDARDMVISGNSFTLKKMTPVHHNEEGVKLAGIALQSCINSLVASNTVHSELGDPVNGIELRRQSARSVISGNIVEYGEVGVLVEQSDNCIVDGNMLRHSWTYAVFSRISYNTQINNNQLMSPGRSGEGDPMIFLGGTAERQSQLHTVMGNYGTPPPNPATNPEGVRVNQYTTGIALIANRFRGAGQVHNGTSAVHSTANITT